LAEIARVNQKQDAVLIIPGAESSVFYYWSGSPFRKNLTVHDYNKELLVLGMQTPDDYRGLPVLHGGFSTRYFFQLLPRWALFFAAFFLSIYLFYQKGFIRRSGIVIGVVSLLLMLNYHPFQSSRFDAYHGDQGVAPYQELIDYAHKRGGVVFWAHPESNYSNEGIQLGPAKLVTRHYPDDLIESENYTGFSALYGDTIHATEPGSHWDQILNEYCMGRRNAPIWGIAGSDFHAADGAVELDSYQTIFWVKEKTREGVLDALSSGRVYAVEKHAGPALRLDQYFVRDDTSKRTAQMAGDLMLDGRPVLTGKLSVLDGTHHGVTVAVIRGGKQVWSFEGQTPLDFEFVDSDKWAGKTYYRLDVRGKGIGKLLTNPIFVER